SRTDGQRLLPELAVGQVSGAGENGEGVRLLPRTPKEAVVQHLCTGNGAATVDLVAAGSLFGGQRRRIRLRPCLFVGGQSPQFGDVVGEHRVDHAGGEDVLADIPIQHDGAVEFGDLSVQRHLRTLRDDPTGCAEGLGHLTAEQLAESQSAGEYDRGEYRGAAVAAEVTQHRQTWVG